MSELVHSELAVVLSLCRSDIRNKVGARLEAKHFRTQSARLLFDWIQKVAAETLGTIPLEQVKAALHVHSITDIEEQIDEIYRDIVQGGYSPEALLSNISRLILTGEIANLVSGFKDWVSIDPARARMQLEEIAKKCTFSDMTPIKIHPEGVQSRSQEEQVTTVASTIPAINSALLFNGYKLGDVVMVMAKPGTGKTTFLIQEACGFLFQGHKVAHFFLGDMKPRSVDYRYLCIMNNLLTLRDPEPANRDIRAALGESLFSKLKGRALPLVYRRPSELALNPNLLSLLAEEFQELLAGLSYYCESAGSVDIDEIISAFMDHYSEGARILIVDYDLNILQRSDNMYREGSYIYSRLEWLAQELGVLVLIATQTKTHYWDMETVPLEAAAESSRKQHHVDIAIGLGKGGTIHLAKVREGTHGITIPVDRQEGDIVWRPAIGGE